MYRANTQVTARGAQNPRKYLDMRSGRQPRPRFVQIGCPPNFSFSVSGNKAYVTGGWWRIQCVGENYVSCTTDASPVTPVLLTPPDATHAVPVGVLTLSGNPAFVCVRNPVGGIPAPVIVLKTGTRPPANDGQNHFVVLGQCVPVAGNYSIIEIGWQNDIIESAPLPSGT